MHEVIGAAIEVSNTLGVGFLEKVYERALVMELKRREMKIGSQVPMPVSYKGRPVGVYTADLIIDDILLVELKCADSLKNEHMAQCINYLSISDLHICLLINFQRSKLEWKQILRNL